MFLAAAFIRLTSSKPVTWKLTAGVTAFFAYTTALQIEDGTNSAFLAPRDTVVFDHAGGSVLASPKGYADIYIIEFNRV